MSTIMEARGEEITANLRKAEEEFRKAHLYHAEMEDALNDAKYQLALEPLIMGDVYVKMMDAIWAARHKESAAKDAMLAAEKILDHAEGEYIVFFNEMPN